MFGCKNSRLVSAKAEAVAGRGSKDRQEKNKNLNKENRKCDIDGYG